MEFQKFDKIPRLSRDIVITEKIDGTNAQIFIISAEEYYCEECNCCDNDFVEKFNLCLDEDYMLFAGSRRRWLDTSSKGDNMGFAKWVQANAEELIKLGEGRHFGEWYGKGIQRGYELDEKRFALFNVKKWVKKRKLSQLQMDIEDQRPEWQQQLKENQEFAPDCCNVVPILYEGIFDTLEIDRILSTLRLGGSDIVPGFMNPEGIVIYHKASGQLFKKTIKNDEKPKGV